MVEIASAIDDRTNAATVDTIYADAGLGLYELGVWELGDSFVVDYGGITTLEADGFSVAISSDNQQTVVRSDSVRVNTYG
jgi:hypothetical protein